MDEAVEKLKAIGIEVIGVVCHVSNGQQRKNLINQTIEVRNLVVPSLLSHKRPD